ncbi:MAG TPA: hypothetical protein VF767_11580 [Bryobacteraceae bacterium]
MQTNVRNREARLRTAQKLALAACLFGAPALQAQAPAELRQVLERLDRLEEQNRALIEEVRALRQELSASHPAEPAPVEERVAVQETRVAELAQTKVEASQRFPIRITGTALFNTFFNSNSTSDTGYPTFAPPGGEHSAGATFRQTTLGLEYLGPRTFGDGKVRGSVLMDFFGGSGRTLDQVVRLRTAVLGVDWTSRSVEAGIEKPLISPRDPDSLAQVGVSPLSGAGNLWLWIPQVRVEQKLRLGDGAALRAQVAAVQTSESLPGTANPAYAPAYDGRRPGVEGRLEFSRGEEHRIEVAPGFHRSVSHAAGTSIPSNIFSIDWFARPLAVAEFKGAFFTGQNVTPLGAGGYRQGYTISGSRYARAVHSRGGWAQLTLQAAPRLSFHLFSGAQDDRERGLTAGSIGRNLVYGANFFYRLAPNVLASFEASQARTSYVDGARRLNNHYDLALGYLF